MAEKIQVVVDVNTESVTIATDRTLTLQQQLKVLKKELQTVPEGTQEWNLINSKFNDTKDSLFKGPFAFIFKNTGGFPVDRFNKHNMVDQVVGLFNSHDKFVLALSPEGTRKKTERLRTGFYHIAKNAGVPIVMVGLDFGKKEVRFAEPFYTSDNEAEDFKKIITFFAPLQGKIPAYGMAHLLDTYNNNHG